MREAMGEIDEPELNQRIGDYELLQRIAQGGMGVVFKARQISVGRTVALKMILGGVLATETEVQRFAAEAEAAANLDHPNIVPIYEIGAHQGRHFYTMKFVEGGDLSAHLDEYRDPIKAARLIATCARAVHHGHRRGVLHRDLKPANILLDVDGVPHVTDFGVAKRLDTDAISPGTLTGTLLGTPAYMAPEQAAGKVRDITTAADIYSLGAILYHLVTARPPFIAESLGEQLRLITEQPVTRPRTVNRKLDADLETIILKCLEKDRRQRYASAGELADDLDKLASGEPIRARPVGRIGRSRRWIKRHPVAGLVMLLLATSLVTVTTAALLVARDAERARLDSILSRNANTPRAVPGSEQRQIEVFSRAVTESAHDENFRTALAASDAIPLREHVRRMLDQHNRPGTPWRTSAAAREPFTSFFVVDATGVMRAHAPLYRATGEDFSARDYFQHGRTLRDGQPYVSRLYKAVTDGKYKIAIAVPIRENDTFLGLLVASISIDSQFGDLQLDDDARQVALVSPLEAPSEAKLVLFRHPRYDEQSEAFEIRSVPLARYAAGDASAAATDANYRDPLFRNDRYLASFARVPQTHIVVVVQQRYHDALRAGVDPARRIVLWGGAALALAALAIALASMLLLSRRPTAPAPR
jgi:serine/threonine-protein kinase